MNHIIQSVLPMENFILGVKFSCGAIKLYDMNPLFSTHPIFAVLKEDTILYSQVVVDTGGKGVIWNDDLDLSADELWDRGWPEWKEEDLVTIEIEIEEELFRKVTERLKPYGLTPEDWAVMCLELLAFPPTRQRAISLLGGYRSEQNASLVD